MLPTFGQAPGDYSEEREAALNFDFSHTGGVKHLIAPGWWAWYSYRNLINQFLYDVYHNEDEYPICEIKHVPFYSERRE
jgi:hypothetical protein